MTKESAREERGAMRERMRAARRDLSSDAAAAAAQRLAQRLLGTGALSGPGRLATYLPTDGEIDPNVALHRLIDRGWQTHLPVIDQPDVQVPGRFPADAAIDPAMGFAPWRPGEPLRPNRFGIGEPDPLRSIGAGQLDVVIVPCVAVDGHGHRLGFGAGYYDRSLASWSAEDPFVADPPGMSPVGAAAQRAWSVRPWDERDAPLIVAVAYDMQLVEDVMAQPWDIAADLVVTDERVLDLRPPRSF